MSEPDSPVVTLAKAENQMGGHFSEVMLRYADLLDQMAGATETGRPAWRFVPTDEPTPTDTFEAVKAYREFGITKWWLVPPPEA